MAYSITVTAAGDVRVNPWPSDLLRHLYREIDCRTVEMVVLDEGLTAWCDDEGRFIDTPVTNELITKLCGTYGPLVCDIVGTVVLTGGADDEDDTLPLTDLQAGELVLRLEQLRDAPMPRLSPDLFL